MPILLMLDYESTRRSHIDLFCCLAKEVADEF